MENIITTAAGKNYEIAVVRNYMDDELCEAIHGTVDTEQEFYDEYCRRHAEKYGEMFVFDAANPQI